MMKRLSILIAAFFIALTLTACELGKETETDDPQEQSDGIPDDKKAPDKQEQTDGISDGQKAPDKQDAIVAKQRPAVKTDVISLEGMEDEFQFQLYDDSNVGFTTYITKDMIAESFISEEGDSFIAYANFGGKKQEDAWIHIFKPSPSEAATVEELVALTKEELVSDGYELPERTTDAPNRFDFSEVEFDAVKEDEQGMWFISNISIFKRGDEVYRLQIHYPEDYSEGFIPRTDKLIQDIMWYDEQ